MPEERLTPSFVDKGEQRVPALLVAKSPQNQSPNDRFYESQMVKRRGEPDYEHCHNIRSS